MSKDLDILIVNLLENHKYFDLEIHEQVLFNKYIKKIQKIISEQYKYNIRDINDYLALKDYAYKLIELSGLKITLNY
jgi:hypothetical protein